jgi:hypothetical protein
LCIDSRSSDFEKYCFDVDNRIQVTDFSPSDLRFRSNEWDGDVFSGEGWWGDVDLRGFAAILFEIMFGHPSTLLEVLNDERNLGSDIPIFVRELLVAEQSQECGFRQSFNDIFKILKNNDFQMFSGVDFSDLLGLVEWVESYE